jgi:hypothetical protein
MQVSQIPENGGKFQVTEPFTIGGGDHFAQGGCQITLLPSQIYTVDQSMVGLVTACGVCHVEQKSNTFGHVDREIDVHFCLDPELEVVAV